MVTLTNGASGAGSNSVFSQFNAAPADASNSFAQQLFSALAAYMSPATDASRLQINVQAAPGQSSGTRQFLVTVHDPAPLPLPHADVAPAHAPARVAPPVMADSPAPAPAPAPTAASVPAVTPAPPVTLMSIPVLVPASVTPATVVPTAAADGVKRLANGRPVLNSADAYWATQPAAVQALQNMNSEGARSNLAHDLADQGYLIDVPIMVWGWDPLSTMIVRRNAGFTWIPSAKMNPVQVAPGLNFGGLPGYDANHPPAGSIRVTTDWAKGLEYTDGWLHPGDY